MRNFSAPVKPGVSTVCVCEIVYDAAGRFNISRVRTQFLFGSHVIWRLLLLNLVQ